MTDPKIKPQARLEIYEGMKVETVKQKGSQGQKMMVSLFDSNWDGTLDKNEAALFNSYNFTTEKGKITMYENNEDGTRNITELKYDNFEKDVLNLHEGTPLNKPGSYNFENDKGERCFYGASMNAEKTSIDMVTGKVTVENADSGAIWANNIDITVKNANIDQISTTNANLKLENTKNTLGFWDIATTVYTDGKSTIKADANSKYETEIEE